VVRESESRLLADARQAREFADQFIDCVHGIPGRPKGSGSPPASFFNSSSYIC
jgi:hypothetical protein